MKNICDCYHYNTSGSYCYGTKNAMKCYCEGDINKCDYYPEKRNKIENKSIDDHELEKDSFFDRRVYVRNVDVEILENSTTGETSLGWYLREDSIIEEDDTYIQ